MAESASTRRWREDLQAWALPPELLARAPESPYGWPASILRRWNEQADSDDPTQAAIHRRLPPGGRLLDVGAGTGRIALSHARQGHEVVAVEPDAGMAATLREAAAAERLPVKVLEARWPDAAASAGSADVVVSANVVYDVADVAPFLAALDQVGRWVVVELTAQHPWADLAPLYRALHGIGRPAGPDVEVFVAAVADTIGVDVDLVTWERPPGLYFETWEEILAFYRKRLLVGPDRDAELRSLLEPQVHWHDGRAFVGGDRRMATVTWKSASIS